ncbi:S41 family peptidase [Chitinophaga niabensis]|uniref:S41 family peptidase n=1 Tax=Chitinophaga niabensis TaxID=536979 RepID=UPI0031BBA566
MKPFFCYILCLLLLTACRKNDTTPPPERRDSLGRVNQWILDSMRRFYYWQDEIPAQPDFSLPSDQFFTSLLSKKDRFSYLSGNGIAPSSNSYFIFGFHYIITQVRSQVIGVVTFVNTNGAAYNAGLRRGSYFMAVNGQTITAENMNTINKVLNKAGSLTIAAAVYKNEVFMQEGGNIQLSPGYANENAVHYTRVFQQDGKKTGYLYYSSFDENYDAALLTAFNKFKQAGITELILDLRYNAGGSVASSAKLGTLIADKLTQQEVYVIYQGNKYEGRKTQTLQAALQTSASNAGKQYTELASAGIHINKVYILTTGGTGSASELLVNNLPPFLEVVQIGSNTHGKDEASFSLRDLRSPRQVNWVLTPIIYKLQNKLGQGSYANGILPKYPIDETATLPLSEVGATQDVLLRKALELIYGATIPSNPVNLRLAHPAIPARTLYRSSDNITKL